MAQIISQLSVKFGLRNYHYRTHEPEEDLMTFGPFRTAKAAARAFADHVALDFEYRYPRKFKRSKSKIQPGKIVIGYHSIEPVYKARYEKALRRSLKIFKAMGLK